MRALSREVFLQQATARAKRPVDLSKFVYSGSANKSTAICPDHGEFQISPNALMNRIGCPACALIERAAKRRMTIDSFIAKAKEVHGDVYDYSTVKYVSSRSKILIMCPIHGPFSQVATSHLTGRGCPACANLKIGSSRRLSQDEFIVKARAKHGDTYDLSYAEYYGLTRKVKIICNMHGPFYPTAGNFINNASGCPICARILVGKKTRRTLESYVTTARKVHKDKFIYTALEYINNSAYLHIICPVHGEFTQLAQDHLNGVGCAKCSKPVFDRDSFVNESLIVHGDKYNYDQVVYTSALNKVEIICPTHGTFTQAPAYHVNMANGCPRCAGTGSSKGQIEILDFISGHVEAVSEFPLNGSKRRLDIFIPSQSLAIEYHGLIWHSSAFSSDPLKDYKKHVAAKAQGIRVMHIYQDEWSSKRDIVERTLLSAIGALPKIYARNTEVAEVDSKAASEFFKVNHLQGPCQSQHSIGLFLESTMVACMSFGMARSIRTNTDKELWELQRYASTCTIVGGASRLLKYFLKLGTCHTLVSYSDTRLFKGSVYEKLGFTLEHETDPDYCYVSNNTNLGRIHKSKFQRKHLAAKLPNFDPDKTEVQNCYNNGWYQLFDCGKKKWILECK
jgi:hypothetical protein